MLEDAKTQATIDAIETEIRQLEDKVINIAGR
jgi:flagellin-like hook-associated protein FlgL